MTDYRFETWDIFTRQRFGGNPLAVVFDAQSLSPKMMQIIAAEFNLSETTFVQAPENPDHTARVRIFTPAFEMPFAGHPTVGTALALARARQLEGPLQLQLNAGLFHIDLSVRDGQPFAGFVSPNLPVETGAAPSASALAKALGLMASDIDQDFHKPRRCGAGGVDYIYVRAAADAVRRAQLNPAGWEALNLGSIIGIYLYTDGTHAPDANWHARMFAPSAGVPEDPATGSAATSMPAQIALAARASGKPLPDGVHHWKIEQGYEMGRPSQIYAEIMVRDGDVCRVKISGHGVAVSSGVLTV